MPNNNYSYFPMRSLSKSVTLASAVVNAKNSFTHLDPVVKIQSNKGIATAFKVLPEKAVNLVDLEKENIWFTAGHICHGSDTLQLIASNQFLDVNVKKFNAIDDWCYLTSEPTNGPGFYIPDSCSNSDNRTSSLFTLSDMIFLPWEKDFGASSLFGVLNYTSLSGNSGFPLLVDGYPRGIQIESGPNNIIFSNIDHMLTDIFNFEHYDKKASTRNILLNDQTHILYENYTVTSQGDRKASLVTDSNGNKLKNWEQDSQGNEKASVRTNKDGIEYLKWERDSQGNNKANRVMDKDGNIYENLEIDSSGNQKASMLTDKNGEIYKNWKQNS